jgi:DNA-binding NtrC family response regulator
MSVLLNVPGSDHLADELTATGEEVLIVDDDASFRGLVVARLERAGARVRESGSVREAIEALERKHVDLVLCDYSMPVANGMNLLAYLEGRAFPGRFVLMSASLPPEVAADASARGAQTISKWELLEALYERRTRTGRPRGNREHTRTKLRLGAVPVDKGRF